MECGLCGGRTNLMKTECCGRWICDDEGNYQLFSFAKNSCARNHRRYTLCGSHHTEEHKGHWQDCADCREGVETEMYVWYGTNVFNFEKLKNPPAYEPTHCKTCQRVILLGEEGYSQSGDEYLCEECTENWMQNEKARRGRQIPKSGPDGMGEIERIWTEWLVREWNHVNRYYRLNLNPPQIRIEELKSEHGHWDPFLCTVSIGIETIKRYPWSVVIEVLKHEMAHQYADEFGPDSETSHGPHFAHACQLMGLPDWAQAASGELPNDIPDWRKGALTDEENRLLDRANKLLALAQSDNEHEAKLAMQRVRELYAKYNLEQIATRKEAKFVSTVLSFKSKRIEGWQSLILVILDRHFFVRTISFSQFDPVDLIQYKAAEILGKKENVLMAEYVYHFLERTVSSLWEKHRKETPTLQGLPSSTLRSEKRHFMIGVLVGFRELLDKTNSYQNLDRSEKECVELVALADTELTDFYRRKYPRTATKKGGGI